MRILPTLALLLPLLAPFTRAQSPAERTLLDLANQSRAAHNIAPLAWDPALARAARNHVNLIVQAGGPAQHRYPGEADLLTRAAQAGAHFSTISENVGGGDHISPAELHQAWMNSPVHRANLLDPRLTAVGIALVQYGPNLAAVEDFATTVASLSSSDVERQVATLLRQRNIPLNESPATVAQARAACASNSTPEGTTASVLQWEGPDPSELPNILLKEVSRAQIHSIALGSCAPQRAPDGFTTYHVAVFIF